MARTPSRRSATRTRGKTTAPKPIAGTAAAAGKKGATKTSASRKHAVVKGAGAKRSASTAPAKRTTAKPAAGNAPSAKSSAAKTTTRTAATKRDPVLLSGGNPQIPKGEGDAPVRAYLAAIPGWKQEVARRVDALIARAVPEVHKAVKWNSPFYGVAGGEGWFLSFHCFDRYLKVAFFRGTALNPMPPVASKVAHTRYLHVGEDDLDEAQFLDWVRQASRLPGERM